MQLRQCIVTVGLLLIGAFVGWTSVEPDLSLPRKEGNERACVKSLQAIAMAADQYRHRFGTYPGELEEFLSVGYLDSNLALGKKSEYVFEYSSAQNHWVCTARSEIPEVSGDRYFFVDVTGVIRSREGALATEVDEPVK